MTNKRLDKDTKIALYRSMRRIRFFEEQIIEHYPAQEMKTPVHLCIGQEAIAAGVCQNLQQDDTIFSNHRNHGHCLAKGMSYYQLLAEFYGKSTGCSGGKGGSMHPVDPALGIWGTTAIVGGNMPLAVGAAWTHLFQDNDLISVAFFGDGATEEGTFHEALNFAALKKLPILFVCENNFYATASHISQRQPAEPYIVDRAAAYGIAGKRIDGNNILEVFQTAAHANTQLRKGNGPFFIEALTYRWKSHVGPADDTTTGHRPADELERWIKKCPLARFYSELVASKIWSEAAEQALLRALADDFISAREQAQSDPYPRPCDCLAHVYQ